MVYLDFSVTTLNYYNSIVKCSQSLKPFFSYKANVFLLTHEVFKIKL